MFRKRQKKDIPPEAFAPKHVRISAIIQLCIAFTIIIWNMGYPFMGERYAYKSKQLLFDAVISDSTQFEQLPEIQKQKILSDQEILHKNSQSNLSQKIKQSIQIIALSIPPLERAWLFFAIVISLLLLLKVEGAKTTAWILPFIAILYAIDNYWFTTLNLSPEAKLFPSEHYLLQNYIKEPLNPNILAQKDQLQQGFDIYLIQEWAKEQPSEEEQTYQKQLKQGRYAFNLARIEAISSALSDNNPFRQKEPLLVLILYLLWNICFAIVVNLRPCSKSTEP